MRLPILSLLGLFLLAAATTSQGAIGENPGEVAYRFGQALKITRYNINGAPLEDRTYIWGGMNIKVTFWHGLSNREIYVRDRPWQDREVQTVIGMNSATGRLAVLQQTGTRVTWAFGEQIYGAYNIRRNGASFLTIQTGELARAEQIRSRAEWFNRY